MKNAVIKTLHIKSASAQIVIDFKVHYFLINGGKSKKKKEKLLDVMVLAVFFLSLVQKIYKHLEEKTARSHFPLANFLCAFVCPSCDAGC